MRSNKLVYNAEEKEYSSIKTCEIPQSPDPSKLPLPTKLQNSKYYLVVI